MYLRCIVEVSMNDALGLTPEEESVENVLSFCGVLQHNGFQAILVEDIDEEAVQALFREKYNGQEIK
jgi:hypothetical protein